jgi:hypothetical protein
MGNLMDCKIMMNFPKKMCLFCTLCNLITSSKSEWKTHVFFLNYKKLDTVYFNKINKWECICDQSKKATTKIFQIKFFKCQSQRWKYC